MSLPVKRDRKWCGAPPSQCAKVAVEHKANKGYVSSAFLKTCRWCKKNLCSSQCLELHQKRHCKVGIATSILGDQGMAERLTVMFPGPINRQNQSRSKTNDHLVILHLPLRSLERLLVAGLLLNPHADNPYLLWQLDLLRARAAPCRARAISWHK